MTIEEKMQLTLKLAEEAIKNGELPIAAIIFKGDEIIAKATTTESQEKRFLVHAELNALIEADLKRFSFKERREMQLFTTLEPCIMCMGAAMSFFIGEIYYAIESPTDGSVELVKSRWENESSGYSGYIVPKIHKNILKEESRKLFILSQQNKIKKIPFIEEIIRQK